MSSPDTLQKLFKAAASAPLEKLSRPEMDRLTKSMNTLLAKLEKIEKTEAINKIENAVPLDEKSLFVHVLKKHGGKKADIQGYEKASAQTRRLSKEYRSFLATLRSLKEEAAVMRVKELSAEERSLVGLLANVTKSDGKLFKPPASPKGIREWLAGLGLKRSGLHS